MISVGVPLLIVLACSVLLRRAFEKPIEEVQSVAEQSVSDSNKENPFDYEPMFVAKPLQAVIGQKDQVRASDLLLDDLSHVVEITSDSDETIYFWRIISNLAPVQSSDPVEFYGTISDFRSCCAELEFIRQVHGRGNWEARVENSSVVMDGAWDTVSSVLGDFYSLGALIANNLFRNPAEFWGKAYSRRFEVAKIGKTVFEFIYNTNTEQLKSIASRAFDVFWNEKCDGVAAERGFSAENLRYAEYSKSLIDEVVKYECGGNLVPEVAALLIPVSKLSKVSNLKRLGNTKQWIEDARKLNPASAVKRLTKFGLRRMKIDSEAKTALIKKIDSHVALVDPARLSELKTGNRGANRKFRKLMFHMHDADNAGIRPRVFLKHLYARIDQPAYGNAQHVFVPIVDKRNLRTQYIRAKEMGLFTPENYLRLREGQSPLVMRGPFKGSAVDVDHIVPVSKCPELENCYGNLSWETASANRRKGARLTAQSQVRLDRISRESGWDLNSRRQASESTVGVVDG